MIKLNFKHYQNSVYNKRNIVRKKFDILCIHNSFCIFCSVTESVIRFRMVSFQRMKDDFGDISQEVKNIVNTIYEKHLFKTPFPQLVHWLPNVTSSESMRLSSKIYKRSFLWVCLLSLYISALYIHRDNGRASYCYNVKGDIHVDVIFIKHA